MSNGGSDHKTTANRTQAERLWARCTDWPAIASRYELQFSIAAVVPVAASVVARVAAPEAGLAGTRAAVPPTRAEKHQSWCDRYAVIIAPLNSGDPIIVGIRENDAFHVSGTSMKRKYIHVTRWMMSRGKR